MLGSHLQLLKVSGVDPTFLSPGRTSMFDVRHGHLKMSGGKMSGLKMSAVAEQRCTVLYDVE